MILLTWVKNDKISGQIFVAEMVVSTELKINCAKSASQAACLCKIEMTDC